jgi:hypothetical protein
VKKKSFYNSPEKQTPEHAHISLAAREFFLVPVPHIDPYAQMARPVHQQYRKETKNSKPPNMHKTSVHDVPERSPVIKDDVVTGD